MKPNELRVGNYIYEIVDTPDNPEEKELFEVAVINSIYNTLYDKDNYITEFDYSEPIPLTEEWLLKFGFENHGYDLLFWKIDVDEERVFEISSHDGFIGVRYNDQIDVEIKYVHQLQNLYFALTGEELTIKNNNL